MATDPSAADQSTATPRAAAPSTEELLAQVMRRLDDLEARTPSRPGDERVGERPDDDRADAERPDAERSDAERSDAERPAGGAETFWALTELTRRAPGSVMIVGDVTLPDGGHVQWQEGAADADLLDDDWETLTESLSALAHPVRLRIVRHCLDAPSTAKELAEFDEMGSSGQVYHHLRHLTSTGWLRSTGGRHHVPAQRVVPLLAILMGARR